ncbi:hypothetical protein BDQ12DRAFT_708241 [Crucibulum laeve]|uniref:Smr domain-containing protein n=1 Tax=Crucibulum laeve TaxID=68775 RepID=A0A5C3MH66_9AGAR|nr:hypothetical protein BDQ12DRAFT_708241 [Crucibulum laeve]
MDVSLSIVTGLALRLFLRGIEPDGKLGPALLGIWEGVVVHQLSTKANNPSAAVDHYLGYGLRLAVDLLVTGSTVRLVLVILWTALGAVVSEAISPGFGKPPVKRERERRHRHSRSIPSHVRVYMHPSPSPLPTPMPLMPQSPPKYNPPAQTNQTPPFPPQLTPQFRPSRPPSPPSFFLEGEPSDIFSPSPKPIQLTLFPEPQSQSTPPPRPRSAVAAFLENAADDESGSPSLLPIHLPTPPETAAADSSTSTAHESESDPDPPNRRLSTIVEVVSGDERTPPKNGEGVENTGLEYISDPRDEEDGTPTALPIPLPIAMPNSYLRYPQTRRGNASSSDLAGANTATMYSVVSTVAPLPIPRRRHSIGSVSDAGGLTTPEQGLWDIQDADDAEHERDELMTPIAQRSTVLSPLNLDEEVPILIPVPILNAEPEPARVPETVVLADAPEAEVVANPNGDVPTATAVEADANKTPVLNFIPAMTYSSFALPSPPVPPPTVTVLPDTPRSPSPPSPPLPPAHQPPPQVTPIPTPSSPGTIFSASPALSIVSLSVPNKLWDRAAVLRNEAKAEEKKWSELKTKHMSAKNEKRLKDALILKEQMRQAEANAVRLHERAARRFFIARNSKIPKHKHEIDLHGLRVKEAVQMTEQAFIKALEAGHSTLRVITGKGLHSTNGIPVLKNAILREMNEQNKIPCRVDISNTGVLILTLPP